MRPEDVGTVVEKNVPVETLAALAIDVGRPRGVLLRHVRRVDIVRLLLAYVRLLRPRSVGREVLAYLVLYPVAIFHARVVGVLMAADTVAAATAASAAVGPESREQQRRGPSRGSGTMRIWR